MPYYWSTLQAFVPLYKAKDYSFKSCRPDHLKTSTCWRFFMGAGRQRLEPANQQVYRSIPATNVANQECVEGEAILSARPFKNVNLLAFFYGCWPPAA